MTWNTKMQILTRLVHHDKIQTLNLGQMNLARAFCMKLVPNTLRHVLDQNQKEPSKKELWFGNGNMVMWGSWA